MRLAMEENPAGKSGSGLDGDDDYSKYEVVSRTQILSILRGMLERGSQITFYFNNGYDSLLTSLTEIAADGKTLVFAHDTNKEMNKRALAADKLNCVSSLDKVKIQFVLHGVDPFQYEGRDAFLGDVPDSLVRLQRREYYRTLLPKARPPQCRIPVPQPDGPLKIVVADLVDISGGGVGVTIPPDEPGFNVGAEFTNVRFDLPNVGNIAVAMRMVSDCDVSMSSGKTFKRAGFEFSKLAGPMRAMIQRYIIQVESERKSREL